MTPRSAIRSLAIPRTLLAGATALSVWLALSVHGILPILAQSSSVELVMKVEPETIHVGDPFTITLSATYPGDHFVIFPQVASNWGEFEVSGQTSAPTVDNGDGTLTSSIQIEATLFSVGDIPTPELSVAIRKPDGEIINRPVRPIDVRVESVSGDDDELKDIKPQAELPVPPDPLSFAQERPVLVTGTLAGGVGLAILAFFLWRRRLYQALPDPGTPAEIALRELDRIASLPLRSDADFKERYTLVSDCLRVYLQGRFDISAPELTTRQILRSLESVEIEASHADDLAQILDECDLVKFARFLPGEDDANLIIELSREFARRTGVVPTAEQDAVTVGAQTA